MVLIDRVQILYLSMLTDCICTLFVFINVMLVYTMWENKIPVHEYVHQSWHTCFCYGYGHITIILWDVDWSFRLKRKTKKREMEILQVCRQLSHVLIMKSPEQILSFLFHLELYYFLLVLLSVLNLACGKTFMHKRKACYSSHEESLAVRVLTSLVVQWLYFYGLGFYC